MASARIVYASLTGNNEDIAGIIEEAFEDLNVDVTTTEVSQALAILTRPLPKPAPPKEQRMLRLIFLLKKMTSSILKLLQNSWLISSTPCNSK